MKCTSRGFATRIGIPIMLMATAIPAFAETSITTCPFNITTPGNYVVNADLTCTDARIRITASNVSLKLNGHTIRAVGEGANAIVVGDIGVVSNQVGIQGPGLIKLNPSSNTAGAILLQGVTYAQVSQVTIVGATIGISAALCRFLTLGSNVIGGGGTGVFMNRTDSSTLTGNDTSGNMTGIALFLGSGNNVNNNTANGNSNAGINIGGGARVYGNVTSGNGQFGIYSGSSLFQGFNNRSLANGEFDLFDLGCAAWSDNAFLTANSPCVH